MSVAEKYDRWLEAVADRLDDFLDLGARWLTPKRWPTWLRRAFLLTLPVSLPLLGVAWLAEMMLAFVLASAVIFPAFLVSKALRFWEGSRADG